MASDSRVYAEGMNRGMIKTVAARVNMKVAELLVLSPKNDPFYSGGETAIAAAEWFADLLASSGYEQAHLRRLHYTAVSTPGLTMPNGDLYENTDRCWEFLIDAGKHARYLELVKYESIVDNKNPTPHVFGEYTAAQELTHGYDLPDLFNLETNVYGYAFDNQPFHQEVWIEKSTMNGELAPICKRFGAVLVSFEGEVSVTACYTAVKRFQKASRPVVIWYISDFDPAGQSMPVATARKLEYILSREKRFAPPRVQVIPLSITESQIAEYGIPRIPIKETEKRRGAFEQDRGVGGAELDALAAQHPGELEQIVTDALSSRYSFIDERLFNAKAKELRTKALAARDEIVSRYTAQIEALNPMLAELRAVQIGGNFSNEHGDPHDDDLYEHIGRILLDTQRDYVNQLVHYKAFQRNAPIED